MKLFNKWETTGIDFKDLGLKKYVCLDSRIVPHSFGNTNKESSRKSKILVIERLINKMMRSGQGKKKLSGKYIRHRLGTGKKEQTIKQVEEAFDYIHKVTKENPVQVLIRAIENSSPREDITKLQKGGITYTQAVDVAPIKRLDEALKNLALASFKNTYNCKLEPSKAIAEEIILASKNDSKSYAVKRKDEIERIAQGSR
jgi:small subunit ribosomal protein S7